MVTKLKIKPDDYAALRLALSRFNLAEVHYQYQKAGLSDTRFRWDLLWASKFDTRPLYTYLHDSHIDSALKRVVWEAIHE